MKFNQFAADLEDAFEVEPYAGRFFWYGPAVRVDNERGLQDVIRSTEVPVQWDALGLGYIVYPENSDKAWYDENDNADTDIDWDSDEPLSVSDRLYVEPEDEDE